jgi:hypothetical protein
VGVRALPLFLLLCAACVERKLLVRTEPAGAKIAVNGTEVGESPVEWRFDHYGTVLVEADLPGHEPVQRKVRLKAPWWQYPGPDFFADVLTPVTLRDLHEVTLSLEPSPRRSEADVDREVRELAAAVRKLREGAP